MREVLERAVARTLDGAMCGMMNAMQWRLRAQVCSRGQLEAYLEACAPLTREAFYEAPQANMITPQRDWMEWDSPVASGFAENDRARAHFFPGPSGPQAPTVLLLHALMSASDNGYRRLAEWFNARGWNAVFPHLPYHYSRKPRGFFNGELAITANLVRNGETLRQGVVELRQLMAYLRAEGCREFGLIGTSFGGWNGALLSFLEPDFRFLALIQPIVNVEHAIWKNPGAASMRQLLRGQGIRPGESERHAHLSSPLHGEPLCGSSRATLTAGLYDSISPPAELRGLKNRWPGSTLLHVRQGHFGYAALPATLREIEKFL